MSTVWTREQEQELAELFQRYSGDQGEEAGREEGGPGGGKEIHTQFSSADVVSCIMAALEGGEVKRSRKQIVNQLVRQELVADRKSLQKKPAPKKTVSHILILLDIIW